MGLTLLLPPSVDGSANMKEANVVNFLTSSSSEVVMMKIINWLKYIIMVIYIFMSQHQESWINLKDYMKTVRGYGLRRTHAMCDRGF